MESNYAAPGQIGRNQEILGQDEFNTLSTESFVCWSAVIAGALAAASLSLILLILGMGLGLSTVSPWVHAGATAGAIGLSAILWITVSQVLASAAAGYIAGRARFQWNGIHSDEIYFRDTVHGFLAWAVSTLLTAALLTTLIGSILGTSVQAGAALTGGAAAVTPKLGSNNIDGGSSTQSRVSYAVDSLFRKDMAATALDTSTINITNPVNPDVSKTDTTKNSSNEESMRIFMMSMNSDALPQEDMRYLGQLVSKKTGLSESDAEAKVSKTFSAIKTKLQETEKSVREAADAARKASAYTALWLFISLLVGAFVASFTATYGARHRRLV